jgi:glycosyltransferase involved in cell wall biosynthesis
MRKKIVVLTSRENFVWTSMQEIIPMIESMWDHVCVVNDYDIQKIDLDTTSIEKVLKVLLAADVFVVTCFNTKISRFIKIVRGKMHLDTRIVFYLHGLATLALWPLAKFEILHLLTSRDVFIGTCQGDLECMKQSFHNAYSVKIPFTIDDFKIENKEKKEKVPFVYIGRISPQKNLDQLVYAYKKLDDIDKKNHPLFLYGTEDNLGYPNNGLHNNFYLKSLKRLIKELNLEEHVILKGFVERQNIQVELGCNYIFISPTTHSDENFGMAAFRSLLTGVPCILTSWGGHKEFIPDFSKQVQLINIRLNQGGPSVDPNELFGIMKQVCLNFKSTITPLPKRFSREAIVLSLKEIIEMSTSGASELVPTELAQRVFDQQKFFELNYGEIQRCFKSFDDECFITFFKAYSS